MKPLDWGAMFEDMQEVLSDQEVIRRTGINLRIINRIKNGGIDTSDWDVALQIVDTYLKVLGVPPPKLGGHNVYIKEGDLDDC